MLKDSRSESLRPFFEFFYELDFVAACALGGSVAENKADIVSDTDIFLYCSDDGFLRNVKKFGVLFGSTFSLLAGRYRGYLLDIGYQYTSVLPGPIFLDIFLNCSESLRGSHLLSKNKILFDKTGEYSRLVTSSTATPAAVWDSPHGEFLIELDLLAKFAKRREFIPFAGRLERIRMIYIALLKQSRGVAYNSYLADRHVRELLGPEFESRLIERAYFGPTESPKRVVKFLLTETSSWLRAGGTQCSSKDADVMIDELIDEIYSLCEDWIS
jgi:hypothetical protein